MAKLALQSSNVFSYTFAPAGGTANGYILASNNNPILNIGGDSWTIECWVKPVNITAATDGTIFAKRQGTAGSTSYQGFISSTNGFVGYFNGVSQISTARLSNTWNHIAWVFNNGANLRIFLNGSNVLTTTAVTSVTNVDSVFCIGSLTGLSSQFNGDISNFRIIKGQAIYSGNFNIPNYPFQLPNNAIGYHAGATNVAASLTGNVIFLTCNDQVVKSNGNTATDLLTSGFVHSHAVDTRELQNYSYFFPGNSNTTTVQNSTVLVTSTTNSLNLNTSDFTIETWYYPTTNSGVLIERGLGGVGGNNASYVILWDSPNNQLNFAASNANGNTYSIGSLTGPTGNIGKPTLSTWNHVAISRTGTTYRGFLNGSLNMNITNNANSPYDALGRGMTIGGMFNAGQAYAAGIPSNTISGYISNMRIVRGNSIYNAAFTVAQSQIPIVNNTVLLTGLTPVFEDLAGTHTLAVNGANEIFPSTFSPFTANGVANSNNSTWSGLNFSTGRRLGKIYIKTNPENYARAIISSFSTGRRLGRIYNKNDPTYVASIGLVVNTIGNRLGRVYPKTTTDSTKFSYMPMVAPTIYTPNIEYQFWS